MVERAVSKTEDSARRRSCLDVSSRAKSPAIRGVFGVRRPFPKPAGDRCKPLENRLKLALGVPREPEDLRGAALSNAADGCLASATPSSQNEKSLQLMLSPSLSSHFA